MNNIFESALQNSQTKLADAVQNGELLSLFQALLDVAGLSALSSSPKIEDASEEEFGMSKKEYGLGSVFWNEKRKCYQAAFYMEENGVKKRKILSAPTRDQAYLSMAQLRSGGMALVSEPEAPRLPEAERVKHTVSEIWEYILVEKKKPMVKPKTYEYYRGLGKPIIQQLGGKFVEDLNSQDIQRFLNQLKYKENGALSSESRTKKISEQLKLILTYAYDEEYISRSPYNSNVQRPKGVALDPTETALTVAEVEKLLKALKHHESPVLRAIVPALLLSGLRIGELLALRYCHLNRAEGTIRIAGSVEQWYDEDTGGQIKKIGTTKTAAGTRTIPVPQLFFSIIDNWYCFFQKDSRRVEGAKRAGLSDIIFLGNTGQLRNAASVRTKVSALLKKLGLKKPNTTFHGFRRTYATFMYEADVADTTIAKLLGHELSVSDGADVARQHYINKARSAKMNEDMMRAVESYDKYFGEIFRKNIKFTHLRKKKVP